jgi:hypothetical protein
MADEVEAQRVEVGVEPGRAQVLGEDLRPGREARLDPWRDLQAAPCLTWTTHFLFLAQAAAGMPQVRACGTERLR